jgi:hypothetical protein
MRAEAAGRPELRGISVTTTNTAPRHEYLDTRQAAGHLGISPNSLACWRSRREGPAFVKIGAKVRYRLADLEAWVDGRRRDPSSRP